jgi:hypothetical protein
MQSLPASCKVEYSETLSMALEAATKNLNQNWNAIHSLADVITSLNHGLWPCDPKSFQRCLVYFVQA